jgi:hypothetical protein
VLENLITVRVFQWEKCVAQGLVTDAHVEMRYPDPMDHLEVLREKIGHLRAEIAQIQESNRAYRLQRANNTEAQVAHGQRHERLQAIQQELAQLATLGSRVRSVAEMKERHTTRLHLVKKAS